MLLKDYIKKHYATQAEFSKDNDLLPQQVTKYIRRNMVVVNGMLYTPVRPIKQVG